MEVDFIPELPLICGYLEETQKDTSGPAKTWPNILLVCPDILNAGSLTTCSNSRLLPTGSIARKRQPPFITWQVTAVIS